MRRRIPVPYAPRRYALPPPSAGMFDAPFVELRINAAWVSHVIGVLEVLNQADAWDGSAAAVEGALREVEALLAALAGA